jgi:putative ABC transport system permease protein
MAAETIAARRRVRHRVDPVWRHAPTVLLRYRGLFAAIAVGSALLALAAAAYPLFLSATTSSLVRAAIERENISPYGAGLVYRFEHMAIEPGTHIDIGRRTDDPRRIGQAFDRLASASPILGEPIPSVLSEPLEVEGSDRTERGVRLFAGTDATEHVELVEGDGSGAWFPDLVTDGLDLNVGDRVTLRGEDGGETSLKVGSIYRSIYTIFGGPSDGYWTGWQDEFAIPCADCSPPPQPIILDRQAVMHALGDLREEQATFQWDAPIADPGNVSLEQVEAFSAYHLAAERRVSDEDTPLGQLFDCCEDWHWTGGGTTTFMSGSGYVVADARERIAAVEGPTRVLEIAGVAVALAVVAAAGAFAIRARRVEAAWLFARGSSSLSVGMKTALESLLPIVVGAALGAGVAWLAVTLLGPDAPVASSAYGDALAAAAVAALGAALLIAIVAGSAYVRVVDPHGRRFARIARAVPWELVLAAIAFLMLQRLRSGGAFVKDPDTGVRTPSLALVAFPFLFLAAFSTLAARLAMVAWGWLRRVTEHRGSAVYLATRRLAGAGVFTMLLVGAAGLCLGTFLHAQIVSGSLSTTVGAKAGVFVGSDVQGRIDYRTPLPDSFEMPTTRVVRVPSAVRMPGGRALDVLAIDADTFAGAAYWNDAFVGTPLPELLRELQQPQDGRVPAIVAAGEGLDVDELSIAVGEMRVDVIAEASAFPGMSSLNPLLVVDGDTLLETVDLPFDPLNSSTASTELWVKGEPGAALRSLSRLEFPPNTTITAAEVKDIPYISAALDTFVVVNVLGLVAAALVFVGMLLYLNARQRSQVVSYALSSRMGMTDAEHRRALVLELTAMLLWGFAVGAVLALIAAMYTVPLLDPIPTVPPEPIRVLPIAVTAATAVALGALAWVGASVTAARSRRVDLGEVMRVAE